MRPEDLLHVPDTKFFRSRGLEELVFMPYDVQGNLLGENGKAISGEKYLEYLHTVLPAYYVKTKDFGKYKEGLLGKERGP